MLIPRGHAKSDFILELIKHRMEGGSMCEIKDPLDLIANLARRVSALERSNKQLERELNTSRRDIETWAKEHEELANDYEKEVFSLAEMEQVVEKLRHNTYNNRLDVEEIYKRLRESDEKVEMCTYDIVTLGERTDELPKIPNYSLEDLNGKTLRIGVGTDTENDVTATVVFGIDEESDEVYILKHEVSLVE